jgi:hypothetical protein
MGPAFLVGVRFGQFLDGSQLAKRGQVSAAASSTSAWRGLSGRRDEKAVIRRVVAQKTRFPSPTFDDNAGPFRTDR